MLEQLQGNKNQSETNFSPSSSSSFLRRPIRSRQSNFRTAKNRGTPGGRVSPRFIRTHWHIPSIFHVEYRRGSVLDNEAARQSLSPPYHPPSPFSTIAGCTRVFVCPYHTHTYIHIYIAWFLLPFVPPSCISRFRVACRDPRGLLLISSNR